MYIEIVVTRNGGVLTPNDLPELGKAVEPYIKPKEINIFSGRMPVWAYAYLTHLAHPTKGVATFDPRLNGGVIVQRHSEDVPHEGEIVSVEGHEKITIEF